MGGLVSLFNTKKVHETKFSRAGIFFVGLHILFRVFIPLLWHNPSILIFLLFFFKKWEIATVNHYDKRKFLCRSDLL